MPSTKRFEKAKLILLTEIECIIRKRRSQGVSQNSEDLLGRMLAAEDPGYLVPFSLIFKSVTKETFSEAQLRDELITFLIAGHGS